MKKSLLILSMLCVASYSMEAVNAKVQNPQVKSNIETKQAIEKSNYETFKESMSNAYSKVKTSTANACSTVKESTKNAYFKVKASSVNAYAKTKNTLSNIPLSKSQVVAKEWNEKCAKNLDKDTKENLKKIFQHLMFLLERINLHSHFFILSLKTNTLTAQDLNSLANLHKTYIDPVANVISSKVVSLWSNISNEKQSEILKGSFAVNAKTIENFLNENFRPSYIVEPTGKFTVTVLGSIFESDAWTNIKGLYNKPTLTKKSLIAIHKLTTQARNLLGECAIYL